MQALPPPPPVPAPALPTRLLLLLVRGYRYWFKPWLGNACRFEPTCSAYAMEALQRHGALRGSALAGWRLLRCHPWCDGGCDPVPHNPVPPAATAAAGTPPGLFTRLIEGREDGDRAAAAPQSPTRKHP